MGGGGFLSDIFTAVGSAITAITSWMTSWITYITGNDLLTFFVIVLPLTGVGIAFIARLIHQRA